MVSRTIGLLGVFLIASACLERVTGEEVPLDPRFYAAVEESRGSDSKGGGSSTPFASVEVDKITVSGIIVSESDMSVDVDVRVPNASSPGGMDHKGKILLEQPGEFSLDVPINLGSLEFQAFQDIDSDGPSGDDPFGSISVSVLSEDISDIKITLVPGVTGSAPIHKEVAPEEGNEHGKGVPENPDPFGGVGSDRIQLQGKLLCDDCTNIDLDLFTPDESSPGGRKMLGKMKLPAGEYVVLVPKNYGYILLEAFVDLDGNGPSKDDFMGAYENNPIQIGEEDISGIDIQLEKQADGKMPMMPF